MTKIPSKMDHVISYRLNSQSKDELRKFKAILMDPVFAAYRRFEVEKLTPNQLARLAVTFAVSIGEGFLEMMNEKISKEKQAVDSDGERNAQEVGKRLDKDGNLGKM